MKAKRPIKSSPVANGADRFERALKKKDVEEICEALAPGVTPGLLGATPDTMEEAGRLWRLWTGQSV